MTASLQADADNASPFAPSDPLDFTKAPASFADVGHARLAYRKLGRGPDVLFIHGWPLSSATFRDVAPHLAERFTCHLIDLPGAGFTEWTRESPISILGHADTICRAVRVLGLERFAIVAHDSGAAIARFVAAREPDRVAALVMGNTEIPGYSSRLLRRMLGLARLPGSRSVLPLVLGVRLLRRSQIGFGGCFADKDCQRSRRSAEDWTGRGAGGQKVALGGPTG